MENIPQPISISEKVWMVPCMLMRDSNSFLPLFRPFSLSISLDPQFRNTWEDIEDNILKEIVGKFGLKHWKKVCIELNKLIYKGIPIRNPKQCRERWLNHLNPIVTKEEWTTAEDILILEKQLEEGNKWSKIARCLGSRTENSVKNRWKCLLTKAKKMYPFPTNPMLMYVKSLKEGPSPAKPSLSPNQGFFPYTSIGEISFSTLTENCRSFPIQNSISDVSPSSLLFFNQ